jgi:MFS family permease
LGCALGGIFQCFLSDWIGRKGAFACAAALSIIGGALVAGSVTIPMLIVVRLIQGCGLGMFLALVPLYLTEVAPPRHRGLITGLTQVGNGVGYIS